ncbi:MAG: BsaWI family type II restriction enzyme [Candidatus Poribacteria bacterium]|nr:BsaWI family type II restriction enzyme [Candidatus Poribacteria bacterium]
MGYDDRLVDTLIERNVIDFSTVDYTSHIIYQLEEHYGEAALWQLEDAVALEGLGASLTGELGKNWHTSKASTFQERIQHLITGPIEGLGMKVIACAQLRTNNILSEELEGVKRYLAVDYREFGPYIPHVDIVIYNPTNSHVVAVIRCEVNLRKYILGIVHWRFKIRTEENTASIKFYLVTTSIDETVEVIGLPPNARAIAETDLDGTYVLTAEALEESDKVKLFEHFIEDLKQVIEESQ